MPNLSKLVDNPSSDKKSLTTSGNPIIMIAILHTNTLLPCRNPKNPLDKSAFAQSISSTSTARSPQAQSIVEKACLGLVRAAFQIGHICLVLIELYPRYRHIEFITVFLDSGNLGLGEQLVDIHFRKMGQFGVGAQL